MSYREAAPSTDVSHLVFSFWEFTTVNEDFGSIGHEIFPDGCVSLFYRRNVRFNINMLGLSGLNLESVITPVLPNDVFWGMRISPAACANVLRVDPEIFKKSLMLEAERFPQLTAGLFEKLSDCGNFENAVAIYESHLKELNVEENASDEKIVQAIKIIEENSGEIKISSIAGELNLSVRQFERRFKKSSGLMPKQFVRTRRIRAAAVDMVENARETWANRAAKMGFSDQSHLVHEFVSVTKRSPNSFAEKIKQIEHGKLVK